MDEKKKRLNIKIKNEDKAFFTDNVTVLHNPNKFVIDFSQTVPKFDNINGKIQQTLIINHNTVVMDPAFAKILLKTLDKNIKGFEKNFGNIKTPKKTKKRKKKEQEVTSTRYIG